MTLKKLQQEAYKVRMTPEEKAAMRARIFGAPRTATSTASPYFFFDFQFMTRALAALLVVVLVGGTGIAYASQGALPGQPLYAVKVDITEPIQTALATTPAARAQVHVELAQRRVEEAEALAAQGHLDATTTQQLEQNLDSHAQSADTLATEVGATDPSAAVEIKAELASALGVHGQLLATIASQSVSSTTRNNSESFAARVIARADAAEEGDTGDHGQASAAKVVAMAAPRAAPVRNLRTFAAIAPEATATATATSEVTTSAPASTTAASGTEAQPPQRTSRAQSELQSRAQSALDEAQSAYNDAKSNLDATTTAALEAQFSTVQDDMSQGDYTSALQLALRLQVIIEAQHNYRTDIITPLLQLRFNTNNTNENHHGHWGGGDSQDDAH